MLVSVRHYLCVCSGSRQAKLPCALMSREPAESVIQFSSGSDVGHDLLDRALDVHRKVSNTTCLSQYCAETPRDTAHTCERHILHGLILGQLPCKAAIASDNENRRCLTDGCLKYLGRFVWLM